MDEQTIRNLIRQEIDNYRTTFQASSVTPHVHNGSDSQQIRSSDLYPYDFIDDLQTSGGTLIDGFEGQIYYNQTQGYIYIFLNEQWNILDINASGLQAFLLADQTVPDSTPTTILFDDVLSDPQAQYDPLTGVFNCFGYYIIHARATFDAAGVSGGPVELTIWSEDGGIPLATSYTTDSNDTVTAEVTYIANMSVAISVRVTQTSGANKDLLSGLSNTSLFIKKFTSI